MKKAILKIFGVAALAAGMLYNVQVFDSERSLDISLAALGTVAIAQSEGDGGDNSSTQTITKTVTEITYKKWDASIKAWIFSSVGGSGYTQVTTTYSFLCCYPGGPGCAYNPC